MTKDQAALIREIKEKMESLDKILYSSSTSVENHLLSELRAALRKFLRLEDQEEED